MAICRRRPTEVEDLDNGGRCRVKPSGVRVLFQVLQLQATHPTLQRYLRFVLYTYCRHTNCPLNGVITDSSQRFWGIRRGYFASLVSISVTIWSFLRVAGGTSLVDWLLGLTAFDWWSSKCCSRLVKSRVKSGVFEVFGYMFSSSDDYCYLIRVFLSLIEAVNPVEIQLVSYRRAEAQVMWRRQNVS